MSAVPGTETITVIGVGVGGREDLSPARVREILAADLLCASARHQEQFPEFPGERLVIASNVKEVAAACEAGIGHRRVVVLGTGDPNFFGIGRYLASRLGPERLRILPAPSTIQEAFARLGLPWHEARFGSCHGRPIEGVIGLVRENPIVGLFTDPEHTPARIARALIDAGLTGVTAHVCCRLGEKDESRFSGDLETLARTDLPDPNVTIAYECEALPVEVVVRGYITGVTKTALWYRYSLGERVIYGHHFPDGLHKNQPLPEPIITPTTKGGPTCRPPRWKSFGGGRPWRPNLG